MREQRDQELILRRIKVERARGTPFNELMDIIQDMVESQRLTEYLAGENVSRIPEEKSPADTKFPP